MVLVWHMILLYMEMQYMKQAIMLIDIMEQPGKEMEQVAGMEIILTCRARPFPGSLGVVIGAVVPSLASSASSVRMAVPVSPARFGLLLGAGSKNNFGEIIFLSRKAPCQLC